MTKNDYRNTDYCPRLENVEDRKKVLEREIRKNHPRLQIMYNKIHSRGTIFNQKFCNIYNCKCAYCGVSMDLLPAMLFEIDHFVAESYFDDKTEAGKVENLVLACYQCNRNKKKFEIKGEYTEILNTDNGKIADVFYRDEKYYIRIKDEYAGDEIIKSFYDQLKLVQQSRRLDYLWLNMQGLQKQLAGTAEGEKLLNAMEILRRKRNRFV